MSEFLKVFLRGIVITLLLPVIVAFFAIYLVYLVVVYVVMLFRNAVVFFMGGSIMDTKQDVEARKLAAQQKETAQTMTETLAGLMHSAIAQNPEAVQAMAQQQMAMNRMNGAAQQSIEQPVPQVTNEAPLEIDAQPVVEEEENND